ncbi:hypothetical protein [Deinococcus altitudinis]|uniref:hypothetical protein n=1 Tax=Deinococcus altitudinis TaxID=468914 RepID=UPI00389135D5
MTASPAAPGTHEVQVCVPAYTYASLGYLVGYSITVNFSFGASPGTFTIKGKWASHVLSSHLEELPLELRYAKGQPTAVLVAGERVGEITEIRKADRQHFTYLIGSGLIGSGLGGRYTYNVQLVAQGPPVSVLGEAPTERWPALVVFLDRLQSEVRSSVLSS